MSDTPLDVARAFIRSVEAKDLDGVGRTLAADARQLFMHSRRTTTPEGVADIVAGRSRGWRIADVAGRLEIVAYTEGLFAKFDPLVWRDHEWTVAPDGKGVYFHGRGDMVVARSGRTYRNTCLTRFTVEDGRITSMTEYADAFLYAGLRVRPNRAEFRALLRAWR
ncbi:nuclear transport factor 2 family protein [Actinoplanes rectilineatus]|uniref:nuclear transport factor 2 family protein n=1 Tax=Actinoplanes rectilineatus TaxID=113571 RepID=UPI0005F2EB8D|nr:nuclear transport factor 2 family protein [Actinoplanes rectilineatus]